MEISKKDFERAISLSYQRGRVTPVRFIEQTEIDECISDIYELLDLAQHSVQAGGALEGGFCSKCGYYVGLGEWHKCPTA